MTARQLVESAPPAILLAYMRGLMNDIDKPDERTALNVYIVTVDYGYEGITRDDRSFKVFPTRLAAETFKRWADECSSGGSTRVIIEAEWIA